MTTRRLRNLQLGIILAFAISVSVFAVLDRAEAQRAADRFVFSSSGVEHSNNKNIALTLGQRATIASLRSVFQDWKVATVTGEDCLGTVCAVVQKGPLSLSIGLNESGTAIVSLTSRDRLSSDIFGNIVGSPVRSTLGAVGHCRSEATVICEHEKLGAYATITPTDTEKCHVEFSSQAAASGEYLKLPSCLMIEAFVLFRWVK